MSDILLLKLVEDKLKELKDEVSEDLSAFDKKLNHAVKALPEMSASIRKSTMEGAKHVLEAQADAFAETIRNDVSVETGSMRKNLDDFRERVSKTFSSKFSEIQQHLIEADTEIHKVDEFVNDLAKKFDDFGRRIDETLADATFKVNNLEKRLNETDVQMKSVRHRSKTIEKKVGEVAQAVTDNQATTEVVDVEDTLSPSMTYRGVWSSTETYPAGSVVRQYETLFISTQPNTNVPPTSPNQTSWDVFQSAGGMGGGFSTLSKEKLSSPLLEAPNDSLYGRRGPTLNAWDRAERFIVEWQSNIRYFTGDKVIIDDPNDGIQIWDRLNNGVSGPNWDAAERLNWRLLIGSTIIIQDTAPSPVEKGRLWFNSQLWTWHIAYEDTDGVLRWTEAVTRGSRPMAGGGGGSLPPGGLTGQLLRKNSAADQDASWSDIIDGGGF